VLERAHALRHTIHELFLAVSHGEPPAEAAVAALNGWLRKAPVQLEVTSDEPEFGWTWAAERGDLSTVLHPVAWAASQLLVSPELQHVNACANDRCGWIFVDTSRTHNRKWCEMSVCGNRAKARRFYERRRSDQAAAD
jgi:predicted RNA-binding Zn ribbon-like protein